MGMIYVHGGSGNLNIETDECRLGNGDVAFPRRFAGQRTPPPLPDWYVAPTGSTLRESVDMRGGGCILVLSEILSSRATSGEILSFYESRTEQGRLPRSPEPLIGRAVPGFTAESADYAFSIDLYQHNDLTSWTIELTDKTVHPGNRPLRLRLLEQNEECAILQNLETGEECIAPARALIEVDPQESLVRYSRPQETETILWSSLPDWIQFGFTDGTRGELYRHRTQNGGDSWNTSISIPIEDDDHRDVFEACLNNLDACGFDAGGIERPERSYLVSVRQWGHSLNARMRSDAGDGGSLTVLKTLGNLSAFLRYSPPCKPGTASDPQ